MNELMPFFYLNKFTSCFLFACFAVVFNSPEPRLQLFCAWSRNQNFESELVFDNNEKKSKKGQKLKKKIVSRQSNLKN